MRVRVRIKLLGKPLIAIARFVVRTPSIPSMTFSGFLHTVALAVLVSIPPGGTSERKEVSDRVAPSPTEIRIDDRTYFVAALSELPGVASQPLQSPRVSEAPAPPPTPRSAAKMRTLDPPPAAPSAERPTLRAFVPPEIRRDPNATQILIQPQSPPDLMAPATPLPTFRVSTEPAPLPKFRRAFVVPGRREVVPPATSPAVAPPDLNLPNLEPPPVQIETKLVLPKPPAQTPPLPVPPGPAPAPVGDSVNIVSVSDHPAPVTPRLVVPPGNLAPPTKNGDSAGLIAAETSQSNASPSRNVTTPTKNGDSTVLTATGSSTGEGASRGSVTPPARNGNGPESAAAGTAQRQPAPATALTPAATLTTGQNGGRSGSAVPGSSRDQAQDLASSEKGSTKGIADNKGGASSAPASAEASSAATPSAGVSSAPPTSGAQASGTSSPGGTGPSVTASSQSSNSRPPVPKAATPASGPVVITRPSNGNFTTVVVQSSPLDQYPETRGLLTHRPIYSVYVSVGTAMDWTFFYCVPENKAAASKSPVVEIGAASTPVKAPFPTRLVRPAVSLPSGQRYILVHGFVTAQGRFEGLTMVKPAQPETDQAVLASLTGWEFRAATKDDVPIAVEFLLSIPAKGL